jgi:hypothetical protein
LLSTTILGNFLLTVFSLLVVLAESAGTTAAGEGKVGDKAALEVVLVAEIDALHHERDDGETNVTQSGDEDALIIFYQLARLV